MTIDLPTLYVATGTAKLANLPPYEARVRELVRPGRDEATTNEVPARP